MKKKLVAEAAQNAKISSLARTRFVNESLEGGFQFTVSGAITYLNENGAQVPIEYCAVRAFGLQDPNDPLSFNNLISTVRIFPNSNGNYQISVDPSGYNWFRIAIFLEAPARYSWRVPPDDWNGNPPVTLSISVIVSVAFQEPPGGSATFDVFIDNSLPLHRQASVLLRFVQDGYDYAELRPGNPPDPILVLYNIVDNHNRNYFTLGQVNGNPIPIIVIDNDD